jgi:hypothetical protein
MYNISNIYLAADHRDAPKVMIDFQYNDMLFDPEIDVIVIRVSNGESRKMKAATVVDGTKFLWSTA